MFSENVLIYILKNKKYKTIFDYQTCFLIFYFILKNRKLLLKIVTKQIIDYQI